MSGDDGLRSAIVTAARDWEARSFVPTPKEFADAVLAVPEVATLRAKAAAADRVRELADWFDASPDMNSNRFTADRIRRALDGDGS